MTPSDGTLTISELAAEARVNVETIRYYEREGILPEPPRTAAGYRQYSDADRWRLAFIRRGKGLGFTLREIAELLGAGDERSVAEVQRVAASRLEQIDRDIADLATSRDQLQRLIETCATGSDDDCLDLAPPQNSDA
ncbi:MAG: MerR family transcriptional regulator [Acidimicrobiia bacterium]